VGCGVWGEGIMNYEVGRINRVCGKKFFVGVGVWGVGFYPFSGGQLPKFQGKSA